MLQGRAELDGQPPVGDQHKTNHGTPRGRVPVAPHERVLILTIRSPSARGIFEGIWRMLHCDSESFDVDFGSPPGGSAMARANEGVAWPDPTVVMVTNLPTSASGGGDSERT